MKQKSLRGVLGSMGSGQKDSKEKFPLEDKGLKPLWLILNMLLSSGNFKNLCMSEGTTLIEHSHGWPSHKKN